MEEREEKVFSSSLCAREKKRDGDSFNGKSADGSLCPLALPRPRFSSGGGGGRFSFDISLSSASAAYNIFQPNWLFLITGGEAEAEETKTFNV